MKQRILSLLLFLALLSACQAQTQKQEGTPFIFYYPAVNASSDGTLLESTVYFENGLPALKPLVQAYLESTLPEGAYSAVPEGWTLQTVSKLSDGTLLIAFEGSAASSIENSLAAACFSKTFLQFDGIVCVSLTLPGRSEALLLTQDDVLFEDTSMLPQKEQIVLYYPDDELRYLVRETRTVEAVEPSEKPAYIIEQLLTGKVHPCIPEQTQLLGVQVENGVCTVNFSSAFSQNMERSFAAERMALYSIVNSLTELEEIQTVDIWVAHAPLERLYLMDLTNGITRDERLLQTEDGLDATLYPTCGNDDLLVAVPMSVETDDSKSDAELLMNALLAYDGTNGIESCIPQGTKLLSLSVTNGTCVIDLTAEFLDGCANEREEMLAVRSIIATISTLPSVNSVEILVEGIVPAYRSATLQYVRTPVNSWFSN